MRSQTLYHALAYARHAETPDTIVLDIPREPYVSIGFFNNAEEGVDMDFCEHHAIPVIRRETGGGIVYIDNRQLFVQWIFGQDQLPVKTDERFRQFIHPLVETYREFGVNARYQPPNDVHVRSRKIVGTGAATIGNAAVVTGNVLFDFDCGRMAEILRIPDAQFREFVQESLEKYMTSLKRELEEVPDPDEVKRVYIGQCEKFFERKIIPGDLTEEEYRMLEELDKKFTTSDWLHQQPKQKNGTRIVKIHADVWVYALTYDLVPSGTMRLYIRTRSARLDKVSVHGDIGSFPAERIEGLEHVLHNVEIAEEPLREILESFYAMHQLGAEVMPVSEWVKAILQIEQ